MGIQCSCSKKSIEMKSKVGIQLYNTDLDFVPLVDIVSKSDYYYDSRK